LFLFLCLGKTASAQDEKLVVLWTSGDPEVAEKVCLMYTHAAKLQGWFDEVTLVVWGPSSKLLAETSTLQEKVKGMMADGVRVEACVTCAKMYGVVQNLEDMGIEVKGMGRPLTDYLKSEAKILSF